MSDTHGAIWCSEPRTRGVEPATSCRGAVGGRSRETMPVGAGDCRVASANGRPVAGAMDMPDLPGMDG